MEHGSLQNNKRRWARTRYQPMRNARKNRALRHTAYLTAKLAATQIRESGGASGAICRRERGHSRLRCGDRLARVVLHLSDEFDHL
jgi:hypothetical protein